MITAHGSERLAVEAMKVGAYDYLAKPYDLDELRLVVDARSSARNCVSRSEGLRERLAEEGQFGEMIGACVSMRELFQTAARVAATDLPVLLLGESGTGKDLLAQEIHRRSNRARHRLVALNCAALPETLVESELFGYEKGSFTGADRPAPASSKSPTAARCSWTKSARWRSRFSRRSYVLSRPARSNESAARRHSRWMCAW